MDAPGKNSCGVAVRDRESGEVYGLHDECLATLETGADFREAYVVLGPLFAGFTCASPECPESPRSAST